MVARTPRLVVTPTLVAINVAMFVIMVASGISIWEPSPQSMLPWGAGASPLTTNGEPWRLLTATFLHYGILHIFMNMFVLWDVGRMVERIYGAVSFLVLYLLAGLVGSLVSTVWHPTAVSAGASGAVFGVFGGLLSFLALHRRAIPQVVLQQKITGVVVFLG